ncbi:hypothetical protein OsI_01484 [Oryza sativa Indica Group]|uniref:Uncharacterized protein n=1 Tax=Oryza sativa subsp. indica TaxID=39946 RepID=A2WNQ4_ORYSI|nr:hypothetical protein OsI_01484 [Oryza sativa Indica Group]
MESAWIGVRDYSAQLVVPDVVDFVNRFDGGVEGIRRRNHDKVVEMGTMLAAAWGTFLGTPPEMCGSMLMVGLPGSLGVGSEDDAVGLRTMLRKQFKVEVPLYYNSKAAAADAPPEMVKDGNGDPVTGYVRISHQVYNVREEYEALRDAVAKLVADGFTCRKLRPPEKGLGVQFSVQKHMFVPDDKAASCHEEYGDLLKAFLKKLWHEELTSSIPASQLSGPMEGIVTEILVVASGSSPCLLGRLAPSCSVDIEYILKSELKVCSPFIFEL